MPATGLVSGGSSAGPGGPVLGVVSASSTVVVSAASFCWAGE